MKTGNLQSLKTFFKNTRARVLMLVPLFLITNVLLLILNIYRYIIIHIHSSLSSFMVRFFPADLITQVIKEEA